MLMVSNQIFSYNKICFFILFSIILTNSSFCIHRKPDLVNQSNVIPFLTISKQRKKKAKLKKTFSKYLSPRPNRSKMLIKLILTENKSDTQLKNRFQMLMSSAKPDTVGI